MIRLSSQIPFPIGLFLIGFWVHHFTHGSKYVPHMILLVVNLSRSLFVSHYHRVTVFVHMHFLGFVLFALGLNVALQLRSDVEGLVLATAAAWGFVIGLAFALAELLQSLFQVAGSRGLGWRGGG